MILSFEVLGAVVPKGRPRFTRFGSVYTPKKTTDYEKHVHRQAEKALSETQSPGLISSPVKVFITVYMPIPQSWSSKKKREAVGVAHSKKPDLDNLVKSVMDGMNKALFTDDSLVCDIRANKLYGETPRVVVTVETVD